MTPFLGHSPLYVPVLVSQSSQNNKGSEIPVIIGTNAIRNCKEVLTRIECIPDVPMVWDLAFKSICTDALRVKSTNHFPISVGPNEVKTINGLVRKSYVLETAITEQSDTSQSGSLVICPRVVTLKSNVGKVSRIPVRVCNLSAQPNEILPRSMVCFVSPVKVIDA